MCILVIPDVLGIPSILIILSIPRSPGRIPGSIPGILGIPRMPGILCITNILGLLCILRIRRFLRRRLSIRMCTVCVFCFVLVLY